MNMAQSFLADFEHEVGGTRRTLERVPENKLDYRPHDKSMTLGRLAGHVAELPVWAVYTLSQDAFDMAPPGQPPRQALTMTSQAQALGVFDGHVARIRELLGSASDEFLLGTWTLLKGGQPVLAMPRAAILRGFVLHHLIHHRGQLTVYLRLNDVPVPSLYGPSADEGRL